MKSIFYSLVLVLFPLFTYTQSNQNLSLLSTVEYDIFLSDVWGYTSPNGTEYALVGLVDGTSILNLSTPTNPAEISRIKGGTSEWKDIKTYGDRAYIVGEYGQGLQIIELTTLPDTIPSSAHFFWDKNLPGIGKIGACHNIYIEEKTGVAYLAGCAVVNEGIIMLDIREKEPVYLGKTNSPYSHDVYVRNDTIYSSDIIEGVFSIIDVTDKSNPITLATQSTTAKFTHNTWLSDNGNFLFTTDEVSDAPVAAYDISSLDNITLVDRFYPEGTRGSNLIPHNVHVKNDFLITSYYTEGVVITDATKPHLLVQVGNYDTYDGPNGDFFGVWGAFPFFKSDIILASDIENGLFILQPNYTRAAFFEGTVRDTVTGEALTNAKIKVSFRGELILETRTNSDGFFELGSSQSGLMDIIIEKEDYEIRSFEIDFEGGKTQQVSIDLFPNFVNFTATDLVGCAPHEAQFSSGGLPINTYQWSFEGGTPASSTDANPTITYVTPGTYSVRLSSSLNGEPIEVQRSQFIRVTDVPVVNFSFENTRRIYTFQDLSQNADSLYWDFGDGSTSTSDNPTNQFAEGTLPTVTLTATNECGQNSYSFNLAGNTTSLESLDLLKEFQATPNPFVNTTTIHYVLSPSLKQVHFQVTDVAGRILHRIPISPQANQLMLPQAPLNKGIYFGQIVSKRGKSEVLKLILL